MFLDTVADVAFIGYDLYSLFAGERDHLGENLLFLGLDVAGAAIPIATGLGEAARVGRAGHAAEEAAVTSGKLYRGLAQGDRPAEGIFARSIVVRNTPISHVAGQRASQWISTSKSLDVAMRFGRHGVIEIDASKLATGTVDFSSGIPGVRGRLSNWARAAQEVLVLDSIPPEAIIRVIK